LDPFYIPSKEVSRIRTTLKQIVREWTIEGRQERDITFKPCLDALEKYYPEKSKRASVEVLVPGCGLGRLPFEVYSRGFSCQGNEFSYYMLLASNYILNMVLRGLTPGPRKGPTQNSALHSLLQ
jgi:carnosine N-methyltransferase